MGLLLYQGTKNTVALTLDGQKRIVKTHAPTIEGILKDLEITVQAEDYLYPSKDTKIKDNLNVVWKPAQQVEIIQNDQRINVWTTADTVGELLKEQKLEVTEKDKISQSFDTTLQSKMKIAIEKAFPIKIVDSGIEEQVWSTSTTVADFLKQQGVKLNDFDRVEPGLGEQVKANSVVNVVRIEKVTDVVEEPINFAVVTKKDSTLQKGKEKVITEGQKGLTSKQYEVIKENGKEVKRTLLSEKTVRAKKDKVIAVGSKQLIAQVSRGGSDKESPSGSGREFYVSSTAYTANCNGCSGVTATGLNLRSNPGAKVIAVDPRVIPLGSKVYVEGYGYAIAADTGGAIRGHKIDVFFPSKSTAYQWGNRTVQIRVLN
nr:ubiquitin-like domain-containing protein [Peribacillus saganii]